MAASPPFPPNNQNPIGGQRLYNEAMREVSAILRRARAFLLSELKNIPTRRITFNTSRAPFLVNQTTYEYLIDATRLAAIVAQLRQQIAPAAEPVVNRTVAAYEIGTAAEVVALATITQGEYTRTVTRVLASDPWQRRVALVRARVFEQMDGFAGETAADLSRVLMTGIENGQNPIKVAKVIGDRFDVSQSRAERIARTEITGALRRARWDESDDAAISVGVRTKQMHLSALSPTTRATHSARHGRLYTTEEVREWYTQDGNAINCKCTQVPVLVDAQGKPIIDRPVKKAAEIKRRYDESVASRPSA
jgi:SPP1 gp7 family putative phage head morphogenesis protein